MSRSLLRRLLACVGFFAFVVALESVRAPAWCEEEQTIQGELLDPANYLKDGKRGPELVDQTYESVDGGQTLALLSDNGTVYLLLAQEPGEDPNELAYDYVNQQVKIKGHLYERAGLHGIVASSIEPLQPPAAPTGATKLPAKP